MDTAWAALHKELAVCDQSGVRWKKWKFLALQGEIAEACNYRWSLSGPLRGSPRKLIRKSFGVHEMGYGLLADGKPEEAKQAFQNGLDKPSSEMFLFQPFLVMGRALAAHDQGNLEEAQRFADEAQDFTEDRKLEFAYPFIALHQGNISSAQGSLETALEHFTRAAQLALDNDLRPILWQSRAGAGHIHAKMGNEALASRKFQTAQTTINEMTNLLKTIDFAKVF